MNEIYALLRENGNPLRMERIDRQSKLFRAFAICILSSSLPITLSTRSQIVSSVVIQAISYFYCENWEHPPSPKKPPSIIRQVHIADIVYE